MSKTHQLIASIVDLFTDSKSGEPKIVPQYAHISCSGDVRGSSVSPARVTATTSLWLTRLIWSEK